MTKIRKNKYPEPFTEEELEARRAKQTERQTPYVQKRSHVDDEKKKSEGCSVCGLTDFRCLDFHHIHGRSSPEVIVLCANCHRIEHHQLREALCYKGSMRQQLHDILNN